MKLYNTLTRSVEPFKPLQDNTVRMYSCGPTVYDHAHIGNLSAYIFADTLRRVLSASGYDVTHAMNYTDVDDKTIRRSRERFPNDEPREALRKLTDNYIQIFNDEMNKIGNDVDALQFLRATDTISEMQNLITFLLASNFAYTTDDGIYFSIDAYKNGGYTYGQLSQIDANSTSAARIANDEYDKESAHDFALWKKQRDDEPAWEFALPDGQQMPGRPGWHIECSAMSHKALNQPFDIHTGGVDLIFPHHENEIAQSTAGHADKTMAQFFCHNEHILVDGKKMSKSANNFYTLEDVIGKGFDPLAFRLLVLQAHYRNQVNFTWESLKAAQNRLKNYHAMAALQWQANDDAEGGAEYIQTSDEIIQSLQHDLSTPDALAKLSEFSDEINNFGVTKTELPAFKSFLQFLDKTLGLNLLMSEDITDEQKQFIAERETARKKREWSKSDELRNRLAEQGISLRDTSYGTVWYRN